ncbi:hypothetical protein EOM86_14900 [Candidatus Nomurabacteria bacterium]|nr:hypothetical protein [Candidatus Nomurabacteria bacterium]
MKHVILFEYNRFDGILEPLLKKLQVFDRSFASVNQINLNRDLQREQTIFKQELRPVLISYAIV